MRVHEITGNDLVRMMKRVQDKQNKQRARSRARTSGNKRVAPGPCDAYQTSDQMRCDTCNICYDVNDACPPACKAGGPSDTRARTDCP